MLMLPMSNVRAALGLTLLIAAANAVSSQEVATQPPASQPAPAKRGVRLNTDAAFAGYTLYAPLRETTTYLINMKGDVVHSWPSKYTPGQSVYLLDDGSLLRGGREPGMGFGPGGPGGAGSPGGGPPDQNSPGEPTGGTGGDSPRGPRGSGGAGRGHFMGGGIGGHVERINAAGKVLWDFKYDNDEHCLHHDISPMPNGHVLMIAWEKKSRDEAIAAGRDPATLSGQELWPDTVIEVEPQGADGGRIVWEWHAWDHLIQDVDKSKPNYGPIAGHPERININFREAESQRASPADQRRLRAIGYIGGDDSEDAPASRPSRADQSASQPGNDGPPDRGPRMFGPGGGPDMQSDWLHTNSINYNAKLDQIVLSIHNFSEIWIIDHSTTTAEAATSHGGKSGHGGDLLFRWGNPRAYAAGDARDQQLFAQHDARWIPDGLPGAGHITVFNNGMGRREGRFSSIVEIAPPIDRAGQYTRATGKPFGPEKPAWEYVAKNKDEFFSSHISGAHRLPNGNTFICNGEEGRMFEVDGDGKVAWDYLSPRVAPDGGPGGFRGPGRGGFGPGGPGGGGPGRRGGPPNSPDGQHPENPPPGAPERPAGSAGPDNRPPNDAPPGNRPQFGRGGRGGPGGMGPGGPGGVFRATRYAIGYSGVKNALEAGRKE